jgi:hypothetical protein
MSFHLVVVVVDELPKDKQGRWEPGMMMLAAFCAEAVFASVFIGAAACVIARADPSRVSQCQKGPPTFVPPTAWFRQAMVTESPRFTPLLALVQPKRLP